MSYPADVRTVLQRIVDSRSVFCTGCTHSEFLHGEYDTRLCLFSECGCEGWRQPGEHNETTTGDASEG
jgi:hypothetical protein